MEPQVTIDLDMTNELHLILRHRPHRLKTTVVVATFKTLLKDMNLFLHSLNI